MCGQNERNGALLKHTIYRIYPETIHSNNTYKFRHHNTYIPIYHMSAGCMHKARTFNQLKKIPCIICAHFQPQSWPNYYKQIEFIIDFQSHQLWKGICSEWPQHTNSKNYKIRLMPWTTITIVSERLQPNRKMSICTCSMSNAMP